ncbi:hypothetical protein [Lentilactobacillus sp. SPB1-3]|uniref:Uncharacterized protein n=1 Tax=Lentilactobacillus terminaliae TaxID=3003483 RepID=A0ACD5DD89_9LACO|nr:hypothetical protein [Lentilactobacillus sp. SPB1-3]MCZ0977838.1 hypothetical protein [Lentilactobacillus sp. SPB1-3]
MNNEPDEPEKLTREQYRKLKDGKRPSQDDSGTEDNQVIDEPKTGRLKKDSNEKSADADYKTPRWHRINRRLNISMAVLVALIIIVYLILIFIN